jgi:hypothetical protein
MNHDFTQFMHPGPECKCCNPALWIRHPSEQCSCCIIAWEASGKALTLKEFVQVKDAQVAPTIAPSIHTKPQNKEWNIIILNGNEQSIDSSLFFNNEEVLFIPARIQPKGSVARFVDVMMADIVTLLELFPSKGQAKKNGWDKPIPSGFNTFTIGKLKHKLWILNPTTEGIK